MSAQSCISGKNVINPAWQCRSNPHSIYACLAANSEHYDVWHLENNLHTVVFSCH